MNLEDNSTSYVGIKCQGPSDVVLRLRRSTSPDLRTMELQDQRSGCTHVHTGKFLWNMLGVPTHAMSEFVFAHLLLSEFVSMMEQSFGLETLSAPGLHCLWCHTLPLSWPM